MSLQDSLNSDLKTAMKAHDKATLSTVRMLKSSLQNEQIKLGHDLTPDEELSLLSRELKQRKDSEAEFKEAGRDDLADSTATEIKVVERYMPKPLTADELNKIVQDTIQETGATSSKDFGQVMKAVMPKVTGRANGKQVSAAVKTALNAN
ncbi:hypothetical protein IV38_GL000412 [Lactobacillus selangorensis]|uniref:GatB YqeY domain-containing protein n=1 Tax=Lactobacillus selangorensis TaxID=81857 RepID=A0A0R2G8R5_9LACO|nr:GatB/YqeY domain-containing protein [Lactobacillus selangorensis]KRN29527.1 hypothetical protein IV38_GL000412 [Lactobacillus selangorensis]KRN33943.1 hypothetical protein IV40_GL000256 [Lactobacillus selangorensis]